jgi:hypothetical protein
MENQANPFTPGRLTPVQEASEVSTLSARTWTDNPNAAPTGTANSEVEPPEYSDSGSVHSVMTEHYLAQIKDREGRLAARRNLEWLRDSGYKVRGQLVDGKYYVSFSTPVSSDVMSLSSFVKAKFRNFFQQK